MISRRQLLSWSSHGCGALAFAALAHAEAARASTSSQSLLAPKPTHFAPRAKRVIFLCMEGGASHLDTFDPKPQLSADDGQPAPGGLGGFRGGRLKGSPFQFAQHGESGLWVSELLPSVATHADKLCVLKGMQSDLPSHAQAFLQMHCGLFQFPRPSMGAWVLYGLGTENQNIPGFITINPARTNGGAANYGSSFLPAAYQGTQIHARGGSTGQMLSNLTSTQRSRAAQRRQIDYVQELNRGMAESLGGDPGIDGLISAYELAFRMQADMPDVLDLRRETEDTLRLYGIEEVDRPAAGGGEGGRPPAGGSNDFGRQCLLARRMLEAGVRFVEVTAGGWDHHRALEDSLRASCDAIDRPIAGLLTDLEQRGLLEDTLVIWGSEFGRSPWAQSDGRDHNNKGYTTWMAGGGVRGGLSYGATDDYGFEAVEGQVHVHDWHATILHLLGLDHEQLTYRYAGRDMRLTDVHGSVVHEILA